MTMMMMSTRFSPTLNNYYQTQRSAFQSQTVIPLGAKEITVEKSILSKAIALAGTATLIVAIVAMVMLILMYGVMKEATTPTVITTLTKESTTPSVTTIPALCPCQARSSNSVLFPYGEDAGDYGYYGANPIIHLAPSNFECKMLGYNEGFHDVAITAYLDEALVAIECAFAKHFTEIHYSGSVTIDLPSSASGYYFYHRQASQIENALFDCLIPNFKTQEAHVFTWINATRNDGADFLGSFQAVVLFAGDSTIYLIRNYGDDFVGINGTENVLYVWDDVYQRYLDVSLSVDQVRGKREIMCFSQNIYGPEIPRTKERETRPCTET